LDDKIALTRELAARGANIAQLNTVRRELSRVKGGGLERACRAGRLVSLILSDVLGDDLSLIASGPTVPRTPTPEAALEVLNDLRLADHAAGLVAIELLTDRKPTEQSSRTSCEVSNIVIANNA